MRRGVVPAARLKLPFVVEAAGRAPFRSEALGKLFDMRPNRIGYLVLKPLAAEVDLKPLRRLITRAAITMPAAALHAKVAEAHVAAKLVRLATFCLDDDRSATDVVREAEALGPFAGTVAER